MTDKKLMKQAKKRVRARTAFVTHTLVSVGVGVLLSILYLAASPGGYFWPVWPILGLCIGVLAHAASFLPLCNSQKRIQAEYDRLKRQRDAKQ